MADETQTTVQVAPPIEKIIFYMDNRDVAPVYEYIKGLAQKKSKDSRIKYNKIMEYLKALSTAGTTASDNILKHIDGDIWELRPIADRIFFAAWTGDRFIILHQFVKKSQKTPQREIDTAKRRLEEARKEPERYEPDKEK
ncbi:MAG: type II toxin-antitoxin system RelE/ParE family toxin [Clostridiales Family XIII bacterium]|jgi:phage-related protein|nr:type II toxin-antitoxin system RelE/ParE family toxin [Clostridiales Family XIII bacterium]